MQLDLFHIALFVILAGFAVPWLRKRGALPATPATPATPGQPSTPGTPVVPGAPDYLNTLLQVVLNKLQFNQPLLAWEASMADHFRTHLIAKVPGLDKILSAPPARG